MQSNSEFSQPQIPQNHFNKPRKSPQKDFKSHNYIINNTIKLTKLLSAPRQIISADL